MATELDAMLKALRQLEKPEEVTKLVAAEAGPELQRAIAESLAAGQSPNGQAWAPRMIGGRAYANAAKAVTTTVHGDTIVSTLRGPEVFGHFGAHGIIERRMLPDAGAAVPKLVTDALVRGARKALERVTK